jgi:hypothetical protein
VAISLAAVGLLVTVVVGLHGSGNNTSQPAQTQPTQTVQPTQTQPPRSQANQDGYNAVINEATPNWPSEHRWDPHEWTHRAQFNPDTLNRWCDQFDYPPGTFSKYTQAQVVDFEAGCSAAVYDEAAKE